MLVLSHGTFVVIETSLPDRGVIYGRATMEKPKLIINALANYFSITLFWQFYTSHQYSSTSPKFGPAGMAIFFLRLKSGFSYVKTRHFPIDLKRNNE